MIRPLVTGHGRCFRRVRVPTVACARSRPAGPTSTTINRQSVHVSTRPTASGSWSTEAESLSRPERWNDHAKAKRATTRSNASDRGRVEGTNGEGKLRGQRRRRRQQNVVRAPCRDPQPANCFDAVEAEGATPSATPQPVRMDTCVVGSRGPAVEMGVRSGETAASPAHQGPRFDSAPEPVHYSVAYSHPYRRTYSHE